MCFPTIMTASPRFQPLDLKIILDMLVPLMYIKTLFAISFFPPKDMENVTFVYT